MKVIVIGCTHAGTAAVKSLKENHPDAEVVVYERNDNVSFLSCGIALYVEGIVKDLGSLFYSSPDELSKLGISTKMNHQISEIDVENKIVKVENLLTSEKFEDTYDKLIVTTGSLPIQPPIEGINTSGVLHCKNFHDAKNIIENSKNVKNVCIIGAGYIGVELIEAFEQNGKNVTIIDNEKRILAKYLDKEFTDKATTQYRDRNITLALGEKVVKVESKDSRVSKVITDSNSYDTELVILCVGFRPNTDILKGKIKMLDNGAIIVNEYMCTSNPDIYAAGDCCCTYYTPTESPKYIPLATNAVRMGTLAGMNIINNKIKYPGTEGTSGIKIYDYMIASTGLTEDEAKSHFGKIRSVTVTDNYRPEFMPDFYEVTLKLVYRDDNRQIVGAQLISKGDYTGVINTLALAIQNKMTTEDLAFQDQFFQPHFNKPWNLINSTALMAK